MHDLNRLLERLSDLHFLSITDELRRIDEEVSACTADIDQLERYMSEADLDR